MDLTLVIYAARGVSDLSQLMSEIFHQSERYTVEVIAVDGGALDIDFNKLGKHCRDHSIEFSTIRQSPLNRPSPGFQVAARQARGRTIVFMNPAIHIPGDYLRIADWLGRRCLALLPRAWVNVVTTTTECLGYWAPPDGMSLIVPAAAWDVDMHTETGWSVSSWPKADATLAAGSLSAAGMSVGMALVGEMEYRRWLTTQQAVAYAPSTEYDNVDIDGWVLNDNDIRQCVDLGMPFDTVVERLVPYMPADELEDTIRGILKQFNDQYAGVTDPQTFAAEAQRYMDSTFDRMAECGEVLLRPRLIVEPALGAGQSSVRVRSTGDVLVPHEMAV